MIVFLSGWKVYSAAERFGDHHFLVRMHDADRDAAALCGNQACTCCITRFLDLDSKRLQSLADPRTD
jgi:hypothetical protein